MHRPINDDKAYTMETIKFVGQYHGHLTKIMDLVNFCRAFQVCEKFFFNQSEFGMRLVFSVIPVDHFTDNDGNRFSVCCFHSDVLRILPVYCSTK